MVRTLPALRLIHCRGYVGFVAEVLVFVITGIIVGIKVLQNEDSKIGVADYGKLLLLYLLLHLIRFILISLSLPLLRKLGYGLSIK